MRYRSLLLHSFSYACFRSFGEYSLVNGLGCAVVLEAAAVGAVVLRLVGAVKRRYYEFYN